MSKDTGGPAFPVETRSTDTDSSGHFGHQSGPSTWQFAGMSLRDYFAAKAMQSLILDPTILHGCGWKHIAAGAYQAADAMLEARSA